MNEQQESRQSSKQQLCVSSTRLFNPALNTSGINISIPRAAKQTNRNVPLGQMPGTALGTQSSSSPAGRSQFPCVYYPRAALQLLGQTPQPGLLTELGLHSPLLAAPQHRKILADWIKTSSSGFITQFYAKQNKQNWLFKKLLQFFSIEIMQALY